MGTGRKGREEGGKEREVGGEREESRLGKREYCIYFIITRVI